ncbi:hypothetical protein C7964_11919 [Loktanella sp. PT4BL]|jgi:hypothetical protein|uniref:hypothetical protein n=1 Tax=Loktanella sp. PT4BL TaxID=2135611 RepID=UPI000D8B4843|nr:hypothetical protein [Loktanella sp. PT4BL]PXW65580.1 hypothetical protein C7964_11919 [Loktanella sp. PT4BL]
MHPQFTLDLSFGAIRLLYDLHGEPCVIGDVTAFGDDLPVRMVKLLSLAATLSTPPIATTLVVPREHVLYRKVRLNIDRDVEERDVLEFVSREQQFNKDELCVDWVVDGSEVYIAAVEKLTLLEADDFARQHGFVPTLFTSSVRNSKYPRKPRFPVPKPLNGPV